MVYQVCYSADINKIQMNKTLNKHKPTQSAYRKESAQKQNTTQKTQHKKHNVTRKQKD